MLETGVAAVTGSAVGSVTTPFFPSEGVGSNLVDEFHNDAARFLDRSPISHVDDSSTCIQSDCNFNSLQSMKYNPDRQVGAFCEMGDLLGLKSDTQHKSKSNGSLPYNEAEVINPGDESIFPTNLLWNKAACMSAHISEASSFAYNIDTFPPLMSTGVNDSLPNILDTITTGVVPAASKRAITGGHNTLKYSITTRADTWNTPLSGSISLASNSSWLPTNTESEKVPITAYNTCSQVNSSAVSPCGVNLTWAQMLTQQQANSKSAFIGSNFGGGAMKSPAHPGSSILSNNVYSNIPNKCPNGSSLASIYNMFPKKPQHRMMAQWQQLQQQQQHPHTTLQDQLARAPGSTPSNSGPLALHQTTSSLEVNNMLFGAGGSGDTGCNFSSSSLFQPSCAISSQNAISQFPVGSSGDSFPSFISSMNSGVDATPLDSLKFDRNMMDVIKTFESTGISQSTRVNVAHKEGALIGGNGVDDIPPFNEVENNFPVMNNMGHLSALNSNPTSVAPGFGEMNGTNNHAASIRNMPAPTLLGATNIGNPYQMYSGVPTREEGFSRKVFVGGLPPDIDEEEITTAFRRFGPLIVDWPHKTESKAYFPPKGYCFLLFQDERSVQSLIGACILDENKFYWCVSSPTMKDKPVQIRPWNLADSDFVMDGSQPLDPRKTIFVGGVPRPLRAIELALIMDRLYNGVCYAGIDTDPELKYPKGAGRVAFSNQQSYIAAISARFVQLQLNEIDKRVEVKPYVLDNQMCDECQGARCGGKFAPFFCANVTCLQYYCEQCWVHIHSRNGREYHKPLVKEGAERLRPAPYRW